MFSGFGLFIFSANLFWSSAFFFFGKSHFKRRLDLQAYLKLFLRTKNKKKWLLLPFCAVSSHPGSYFYVRSKLRKFKHLQFVIYNVIFRHYDVFVKFIWYTRLRTFTPVYPIPQTRSKIKVNSVYHSTISFSLQNHLTSTSSLLSYSNLVKFLISRPQP